MIPSEHSVAAGGIRWHYLQWGEQGAPFVLWHGVTSDAWSWWRLGPALAQRGFTVYAPDLPGHGLTEDAPNGYSVTHTAQLLDSWLTALEITQPIILGHSWGGFNALVHATSNTAQVRPRRIILEDPALKLRDDPSHVMPSFTTGLGRPRDNQSLAEIQALNPRWHPCDVWWKARARQLARYAAVQGFFVDNAGVDVVSRLNDIQLPTLLLLADSAFGGIWGRQHVEMVKQNASARVNVAVLQSSGHNMHRDSWEPFLEQIERFVLDTTD
jgi:pimeloyl-ACP methyl ester carboxylesterase